MNPLTEKKERARERTAAIKRSKMTGIGIDKKLTIYDCIPDVVVVVTLIAS
jgi:hypothetical protein